MTTRIRHTLTSVSIVATALTLFSLHGVAQQPAPTPQPEKPRGNPADTEVWEPVPKVVAPGPGQASPSAPPADAVVLFDGTNIDQWVSTKDKSPAKWTVADGVMTVNKPTGNIETKRSFTNYQLHLEWRIPENITGTNQARGNSGLFLATTGGADGGYELQILDSYNNKTYVNGQAASIYKQYPPLVNAMRKPGEWQVYDVVWTAPTFNTDGSLKTPAYVTAFHNGVLVQNHVALKGGTRLHRPAPVQGARAVADPVAVARRQERADQLPQYLASGALRGVGSPAVFPRDSRPLSALTGSRGRRACPPAAPCERRGGRSADRA